MEKTVKIYMVRHGQTALNFNKIFRGRLDPPLNKTGHEEAHLSAAFLKSADVSFVISSPLLRAVQTAEPISRLHKLDTRIMRELIDIDFGKWQGVKEKSVISRYPRLFSQWHKTPHKVTFPGGENLLVVKKRLQQLLETLMSDFGGRAGVLVSHRVVCKVLASMLSEIPLKNFWNIKIDTASISLFELKEKGTIIHYLNATSHLDKLSKNRVVHDF